MAWGWECRAKLIKQNPAKPTEKRPTKWDGFELPGPGHYEPPQIYCGNGYSLIKRAPAYSFGHPTPVSINKPAALPKAPLFNVQGMSRKGPHKVPYGMMGDHCGVPGDKTQKPGPAEYLPNFEAQLKKPPAYSMRIAAKPPYQPWDQWTPSPNMYLPPIPCKKPPAYSFTDPVKDEKPSGTPGPGGYDPNFEYAKKSKPAFSLGAKLKTPKYLFKVPAPNTYCEKKFMVSKRSIPSPSFGIRHTPYLGKDIFYLKPSKLELLARDLE